MLTDSITLLAGSDINNMVVASGSSFPADPDAGELFFKTTDSKLYVYNGSSWQQQSQGAFTGTVTDVAMTAPAAGITVSGSPISTTGTFTLALADDLAAVEGLSSTGLVRRTAANTWSAGTAVSLTSEVTGNLPVANLNGGTAAASTTYWRGDGTWSTPPNTTTFDASAITSGAFADARISSSSVTQHQGSLTVAASQVGSGTFADARISLSSVSQYQANLSIAESQITDGSVLARLAANETVSGSWTFGNVASGTTPVLGSHLTTKDYVDGVAQGWIPHAACRLASVSNITTLSGLLTIDGVTVVAGDRILVKNQNTGSQNGIYVAASGAWARATDYDGAPTVEASSGDFVFVTAGSTQAGTGWVLTTLGTITIGTTALTFTQTSSAGGGVTSVNLTAPAAGITVAGGPITTSGSITLALADDLAAVEALATTGIVRRTAANTWTAGTAVSLSSEVTGNLPVANLNGGTGASSTTFWRGDGSWSAPTLAAAGTAVGAIQLSDGSGTIIAYDNFYFNNATRSLAVGSGGASSSTDGNYNSVSLLLHADGVNNATSTADSGPLTNTVTFAGGAKISTAQSKFGGSSLLFDGTDDRVSVSNDTAFNFSSADHTVEFWVYFNALPATSSLMFLVGTADPWFVNNGWMIRADGAPTMGLSIGALGGASMASGSFTWATGTWYHVAVSKTGAVMKAFVNGTQIISFSPTTVPFTASTPLQVGCHSSYPALGLNGYIDDLRITKGVGRYTSGFSVPTSAYPDSADAGDFTIRAANSVISSVNVQPSIKIVGGDGSGSANAGNVELYGGTHATTTGGSVKIFTGNASTTERLRIDNTGAIGIGGANFGTSGQVLTSGGTGAAPTWAAVSAAASALSGTTLASNVVSSSLTSVGTLASLAVTGAISGTSLNVNTIGTAVANGVYLVAANTLALSTNTTERLRINATGAWGLSGATFGTSGQVLTSAGSGAAPTWTTISISSLPNSTTLGTTADSAVSISGIAGSTSGGSPMSITASSTTLGIGNSLTLAASNAGSAGTTGGAVAINAGGSVGLASGSGGAITMTAGSASSSAGNGGNITITAGGNTTSGTAGSVTIAGGTNASNGGAGNINLTPGTSGTAGSSGFIVMNGAYSESRTAVTAAATTALDFSASNNFVVTMNASITTLTKSGVPATGRVYSATLILVQDATGSRTVNWAGLGTVKWASGTAPTLTTTGTKIDVITLMTYDGGTTWLGFIAGQNF